MTLEGGAMREDKAERFKRIAGARTQRVIERARILSNCSNATHYEWSTEQLDKIFGAIDEAVKQARRRFERSKPEPPFTLEGT